MTVEYSIAEFSVTGADLPDLRAKARAAASSLVGDDSWIVNGVELSLRPHVVAVDGEIRTWEADVVAKFSRIPDYARHEDDDLS